MQYSFPMTLDRQFKNKLEELHNRYGTDMMEIEGMSPQQLNTCNFYAKFLKKNTIADATIDDNANVTNKHIGTMLKEGEKPKTKLLSRNKLFIEMKEEFGLEVAEQFLESAVNGEIYEHDSYESSFKPYCYAFSLADIVNKGLFFLDEMKAGRPKHWDTFNHHTLEFISYATNLQSGAVGIPDYLIYAYYFYMKDKKEKGMNGKRATKYRNQKFQEFVYNLNQPYLKGGIQCVTEDTEVLTPEGFKTYDELSVGGDIYTWNEGELNIQEVEKINVADYEGEMHEYKGESYYQKVTPNHRVLYQKFNSKDEYGIKKSEEIIDYSSPMDFPIAMLENNLDGIDMSDDMLKLLVIILTDGHLEDYNNKQRIRITKSPNRWGYKEIPQLLNKLGIKFSTAERISNFEGLDVNKEEKEYPVNVYSICAEDSRKLMDILNYTKKDIPNLFLSISKRQANLFINIWSKLDGYLTDSGKMKLQCDNYEIANKIQHIMFLAGYGSRITERTIENNNQPTIYVIRYKNKNKTASEKKKVHYNGKVWCPTTDDGVVVFRQNNKVFISGNSAYTNVSIFDNEHIENFFGEKEYPNGDKIVEHKDGIIEFQKNFLDYVGKLRQKKWHTFPVISASLVFRDNEYKDKDMAKAVVKHNWKYGFNDVNIMNVERATSVASCCRLINDKEQMQENRIFNSIGGSELDLGSTKVVTLNLVRLALLAKERISNSAVYGIEEKFVEVVKKKVELIHKYHYAHRQTLKKLIDKQMLPLYNSGLMDMDKQFATVGIHGLFEALKIMGGIDEDNSYNEYGYNVAQQLFDVINSMNKKTAEEYDYVANVEQVPAESAAVKLCKKDRIYFGNRKIDQELDENCYIYGNQWIPLKEETSIFNRIDAGKLDNYCGGGAMLHINLGENFNTFEDSWDFTVGLAKKGIKYFSYISLIDICEEDHSFFGDTCPICNKPSTEKGIKIVGYLVKQNSYKQERKEELKERVFYDM